MVYVTGDTHRDFERFKSHHAKRIKKGDTLIILGDFGFIWDESDLESKLIKKMSKFKYNIAFLDGPHENFDLLEKYPLTTWNKGRVREIAKNIFHLQRGEVYIIEGEKYFAFGGGQSENYDLHSTHENLYDKALPTIAEMKKGADNLFENDNKVDYIITHEPSYSSGGDMNTAKNLRVNAFLHEIEKNIEYKKWFFGCLHIDKNISKKHRAVFTDIIPVDFEGLVNGKRKKY